ncbi:MAG TPA: hypothetical protein VKB84_14225 [Candidatus Binataceae bacterium]|nr:hypothetical protein [Candidatus Binataceae bacterium]
MGSGGGPSNTTVTNQVQLPAWAQPYAAQFLGDIGNYVNQGLASGYPFPAQQLYGFTPDQVAGMNMGSQAAMGAAQGLLDPTLANVAATQSGAFLSPQSNPYLEQTFNAAAAPVAEQFRDATEPGIQAQFAQAGSFGGSAQNQAQSIAQQNLGNTLQNLATNIYGGNYEQERQNQIRQQGLVPGLLDASFAPASELMNIGGTQQQFGQQVLNTALSNAENQYNFPFQILGQLGAALPTAVGGAYLSQQTGPNPNSIDPLSGGLAGLLGAGGLLGALSGGSGGGLGGLGGGISALLGGLGSLLPF